MLGRMAAAAALIALAGCAGLEPAGRNARTSEPTRVAAAPPPVARTAPTPAPVAAPPPVATAPTPAPVTTTPLPPPQRVATPAPAAAAPPQRVQAPAPVAAPPVQRVEAPAPPPPERQVASRDEGPVVAGRTSEEVIVPGQRERQVQAPNGDPRSASERMQDIRAWDQCVMRVQNAFEADPMSAQLDQPEDLCRQSLGMADRTSVPQSRLERRRDR
jgi:hypothetical protein